MFPYSTGILLGVASASLTIATISSMQVEMFDSSNFIALSRALISLDEKRYSDHYVYMNAFNKFANQVTGATAPVDTTTLSYYCINVNALKTINRARKQLADILILRGFPAEHFDIVRHRTYTPLHYDIALGLLVTALYPNICLHKDARKILTNEERAGIIHKTSVLYSYMNNTKQEGEQLELDSPLLVYSEKMLQNSLISTKQVTKISFLHFLLFGVKKFEYVPPALDTKIPGVEQALFELRDDSSTTLLDGWLEVQLEAQLFDSIWAIKAELENLLARVCLKPNYSYSPIEMEIVTTVQNMCSFLSVQALPSLKKS